jgi:ParB-like nuclease family protein
MVNSKSVRQPFPGGISIEIWPLEELIRYARNPRQIPQTAIDEVARGIQEFGFRQPIVVDAAGVMIVGHVGRLAAQTLQLTEVPVYVAAELTAAQVNAYRLADNRTNEEASWGTEALALEPSRVMELDPKYCGVIVKHWQDFAGKAAHLEDGCRFAELETRQQAKRAA